jgi:hypothetical protein
MCNGGGFIEASDGRAPPPRSPGTQPAPEASAGTHAESASQKPVARDCRPWRPPETGGQPEVKAVPLEPPSENTSKTAETPPMQSEFYVNSGAVELVEAGQIDSQ